MWNRLQLRCRRGIQEEISGSHLDVQIWTQEREVRESLTQRWDRMQSPREGVERGGEEKNERKEMGGAGEPVK